MIVCPNCNHANPDGAVQCEACYTPLPATTTCPNCGANVQADASFCGQCGYNLRAVAPTAVAATVAPEIAVEVPPLVNPDPLVQPQAVSVTSGNYNLDPTPLPPTTVSEPNSVAPATANHQTPPTIAAEPESSQEQTLTPPPQPEPLAQPTPPPQPEPSAQPTPPPQPEPLAQPTPLPQLAQPQPTVARTQLQQIMARLVHVQTDKEIELPQNLSVIHIGKPNDRIPPDIDVSGFPNSEIVSRIHADIRIEGDAHYIEDVGSSNGTYINNLPLLPGNRHRLRPGDRISLGKGDLVTFLFQFS